MSTRDRCDLTLRSLASATAVPTAHLSHAGDGPHRSRHPQAATCLWQTSALSSTRGCMTGLTASEAAEIIGVTEQSVHRLVHQGRLDKAVKNAHRGLDRESVEAAALARVPARGGHPYFLTATEASTLLGVTPKRVHHLAGKGFLPFVEHNGRRLFRRPQLEVVANARKARWRDGLRID